MKGAIHAAGAVVAVGSDRVVVWATVLMLRFPPCWCASCREGVLLFLLSLISVVYMHLRGLSAATAVAAGQAKREARTSAGSRRGGVLVNMHALCTTTYSGRKSIGRPNGWPVAPSR